MPSFLAVRMTRHAISPLVQYKGRLRIRPLHAPVCDEYLVKMGLSSRKLCRLCSCVYLLIANTHEEVSGYAPDAIANPRTPSGGSTYFGSVYEESGRRVLETTWEGIAEKRKRLDR